MSLTPLPEIPKPEHPLMPLPVPKRKAAAVLLVAVPVAIMTLVGVGMALATRYAGFLLDIDLLRRTWVFILTMSLPILLGVLIGIRSVMAMSAQQAAEEQDADSKAARTSSDHLVS